MVDRTDSTKQIAHLFQTLSIWCLLKQTLKCITLKISYFFKFTQQKCHPITMTTSMLLPLCSSLYSHLGKNFFMENFIFFTVAAVRLDINKTLALLDTTKKGHYRITVLKQTTSTQFRVK